MPAALFGLVAALANAAQSILSKELTTRHPARQLIGPLYGLNALLLLPLAPSTPWVWSPTIVAIHLASVGLMVATAICVWDLFDAGAASAVTTAGALSPIATAIGVALVVPAAFRPLAGRRRRHRGRRASSSRCGRVRRDGPTRQRAADPGRRRRHRAPHGDGACPRRRRRRRRRDLRRPDVDRPPWSSLSRSRRAPSVSARSRACSCARSS